MKPLARPWNELVVGFDDSERGQDALALGRILARATAAPLRLVNFCDPADLGIAEVRSRLTSRLRREAERISEDPAIRVESVEVEAGPAAVAFPRLAATRGDRMVVLGSTHRAGVGRVYPGSVAERVLADARCPVAVAPRGFAESVRSWNLGTREGPIVRDELRVIEVGFDGGLESREALSLAERLARDAQATLRVVAVAPPPMPGADAPSDLEARLRETVLRLPREIRALPVYLRGQPAQLLAEQAEQGIDLLVVGSRSRGALRRIALGGTSTILMKTAPCPVLVVPRPAGGLASDAN